jgi:hypothetical protein
MTGLAAIVRQHYPALEADFARYYQKDLGEELYVRNTPARRILSLVQWLPPDAALWRSMGNSWSTDQELLALNAELLDSLRRLYLQAHSKPGARLPDPLHIPRPGDRETPQRPRGTTYKEMLRMGVRVNPQGGGK